MNNIKKLRLKRKITQVDLATQIEVKQETISAYESGKAQPSCEALVKIADYLRTNATFLELNQNKLMSGANMQKVAKRQQNLAETLSKLADKVDIDQKASTKKANLELRDDLSQAGGMDMSSPEDDLLF